VLKNDINGILVAPISTPVAPRCMFPATPTTPSKPFELTLPAHITQRSARGAATIEIPVEPTPESPEVETSAVDSSTESPKVETNEHVQTEIEISHAEIEITEVPVITPVEV
jgi:hypothetical protein